MNSNSTTTTTTTKKNDTFENWPFSYDNYHDDIEHEGGFVPIINVASIMISKNLIEELKHLSSLL
ncbi:hypothetical protein DERP_011046 [Dermatophagoides pteronyssinus]|uniref:Uncharacterized protein n=1 Tax=Dermatophagoides pteronyssinus TaxID=6956 RepID=A0ABQ8JVY9_DERPT|nr:hypothetical protein DERP_011046 [Dermatophagoides pteronyssinus]